MISNINDNDIASCINLVDTNVQLSKSPTYMIHVSDYNYSVVTCFVHDAKMNLTVTVR